MTGASSESEEEYESMADASSESEEEYESRSLTFKTPQQCEADHYLLRRLIWEN